MDIDISQLRQQFPEYLARVRQGERVRIMSRGRAVAELVPPSQAPDDATEVSEQGEGRALQHDDATTRLAGDDPRMRGE